MKKCTTCGIEKDESNFTKDKHAKDGLSYRCKECSSNYHKANRSKRLLTERKYIEANRDKVKLRQHNRQVEHGNFVNSLKTDCVKCGDAREYVVDFHHVNPLDKEFTIGAAKLWSKDRLENEVKKCVCLCKNCHAEFHHLYGKQPKEPVKALAEYLGVNDTDF